MSLSPETPLPLNSFRTGPDERGHFGLYGGRFVAETLMPLILELDAAGNGRPVGSRWNLTNLSGQTQYHIILKNLLEISDRRFAGGFGCLKLEQHATRVAFG